MTKLSSLDLRGTNITDAGLEDLIGLRNLQWLDLCETQITDAGVVRLKVLNRLTVLRIQGTQVTNSGIVESRRAVPNLSICGSDPTRIQPAWNDVPSGRRACTLIRSLLRTREGAAGASPGAGGDGKTPPCS